MCLSNAITRFAGNYQSLLRMLFHKMADSITEDLSNLVVNTAESAVNNCAPLQFKFDDTMSSDCEADLEYVDEAAAQSSTAAALVEGSCMCILFIGHKNAGKSTIANKIMTPGVIKTIEVSAYGKVRRVTAEKVDIAVLVISARKGEFEKVQPSRHAMLAKKAGVNQLLVVFNKMDDPTVNWDVARYNECLNKILPCLKHSGFRPATNLTIMPCSGLSGMGVRDPVPQNIWYKGLTMMQFFEHYRKNKTGKVFEGEVLIEGNTRIYRGYSATMHTHCGSQEVTVKELISYVDQSGKQSKAVPTYVTTKEMAVIKFECSTIANFELFSKMERFTLTKEDKTVATGQVLKVLK